MANDLKSLTPAVRGSADGGEPSSGGRWKRIARGCRRWLARRARRESIGLVPPQLRQVEAAIQEVVARRGDLGPISRDIEAKFLTIGSALEKLPGASEALVKRTEHLLVLASGRDDGESILSATMAVLREPMAYIDHYREATVGLLHRLGQALEHINRVLACEQGLQRTVAPLKFIRTLFKVESAGLSHEVQSMFLALTEDISALQARVSETFDAKFELLKGNRTTVKEVLLRLETYGREQDRLMMDKRDQMQKALADLRSDLARNRERDIELTKLSHGISQEVGTLVMGLQTQDIVSQKVAHVVSSMTGAESKLLEYREASTPPEQAALLGYFRHAGQVEQSQLAAVRDDLARAEEQLTRAISSIESQIVHLEHGCLSLKEFDRVTAGVDGLIQVLIDSLGEVRTLVAATVETAGEAYARIRPIGGQTSNVTVTMRELSAQIRLIALNAHVQAAQIRSGTGLEVLAAATAGVAAETAQISQTIASDLDQLATELDGLVRGFSELRERGAQGKGQWETQARQQEEALHRARDATLSELRGVGESIDEIKALVSDMKEKVELKSIADARIEGARAALETLAAVATQALSCPELAGCSNGEGHTFKRDITMESERLIQEAVLSGRHPNENPTTPSADSAAVVDDCLFETGVTVPPAVSSNPSESPPPAAQAEVPADSPPAHEPGNKPELGANVELF